MNEHEAQRIASALHELRPDWPATSLLTIIRKNLIDKPRRDVAVALAWVACEANTASPARVLEAGPWWKAAGIEGAVSNRDKFDQATTCSVCSLSQQRCRRIWSEDHEFVPVLEVKRHTGTTDVARTVAELRRIKATTTEPTEEQADEN